MTDKRIIDALQCRLASAQANVARWRTRIAENPTASNHQLGVWRGELRQAERAVEAAERRLEKAKES